MILTVAPKTTIETKSRSKSNTKSRNRSKVIPKKIYFQYLGKEIEEDTLIEKFKFEWCKEYKITEIRNLKIYYKFEDKKAYFVANGSVTIVIDFE
jgi:hypothetical protein